MARRNDAEVRLTADDRPYSKVLRDASKKWGAFGKQLGKGLAGATGKAFKGIGRGLKAVAGFGGIGAVLGGGIAVGNELEKTLEFESALTRLKISSRGAIGGLDAYRKRVFQISQATGVAREEVLAGATGYVQLTGDAKTASESMELFAKIAKGTGSNMEDIAASAAALRQNLGIDPKDFEAGFSQLIKGGKEGSVELKDMAQLLASLAPQMARFKGGSGLGGLAELSSGLQLVRQGFGNASEAATGLESLFGAIVQHSGDLERAGVKVFDKDAKTGVKTLRNFQQIIEAISKSKLAKDPAALQTAFGRKEALRAYEQLVKVPGAWEAAAKSSMGAKDVAEDFGTYAESTAGKLEAAWNSVKNLIAEAFTPERLQAFVEGASDLLRVAGALVEAFGDLAGFIAGVSTDPQTMVGRAAKVAVDEAVAKGQSLEDLAQRDDVYGREAKARLARERGRQERADRATEAAAAEGLRPSGFSVEDEAARSPSAVQRRRIAGEPGPLRVETRATVGIDRRGNLINAAANAPQQRVQP